MTLKPSVAKGEEFNASIVDAKECFGSCCTGEERLWILRKRNNWDVRQQSTLKGHDLPLCFFSSASAEIKNRKWTSCRTSSIKIGRHQEYDFAFQLHFIPALVSCLVALPRKNQVHHRSQVLRRSWSCTWGVRIHKKEVGVSQTASSPLLFFSSLLAGIIKTGVKTGVKASSLEMAGPTRICMWCRSHQRSAHVVGATMFMALMVLLHQSFRSGNDPFTSSLLLRFSFTTHPSSSLSLKQVMAPCKDLTPSLARFSPAPSTSGEVINPSQQALMNVAANPLVQFESDTETAARLAISTTSTNGSKITRKGPDATERSRVIRGSQHENLAFPESMPSVTPDDQVENQTESGRDSKEHLAMSSSQPALATTRGGENAVLEDLRAAKQAIAQATPDCADPSLHGNLYKNVTAFSKSYELMEKVFKVYVYIDGSKPLLHSGPKTGIYASEGQFLERIRRPNSYMVRDPWKAHMFFLPYSVQHMVSHLYVPNSHTMLPLATFIKNYVNSIASRYSFWNRTQGADHFFVSCHDWGPATIRDHPTLRRNAVKVVCNADVSEEFILGKDASLPEVYLHSQKLPLRLGGPGYNKRPILAFFAGQMHGRVRPTLLAHWKDKDPDMKIFEVIPKPVERKMSYMQHMKSSKYCICAMGFEVNSPRIVESIYYDCVPVLIADNFVLPFSDVLDWDSFSVMVPEQDIPNLKSILLGIPDSKYRSMQSRLRHVRQHFVWHEKPEKYDIFNMILHSVWTSRLNQFKEQVPNS